MSRANDIINIVNHLSYDDSMAKKAVQTADKVKAERSTSGRASAWAKDLEDLENSGTANRKY